jgi:predicted phage terminase large subunit-like protein
MKTTGTKAAQPRLDFHAKYEPLFNRDTPCRYFMITGGRGSGKSFAISTALCNDQANATYNTLYLRQTLVSAHISIIPEFWEKIELLKLESAFERNLTEISCRFSPWKIFFRGIQTSRGSNEAQLKSIKSVGLALIDEAQELIDEAAFDRIDYSLRDKGQRNRVFFSLNPTNDKHWIYRRFFQERGVPDDFNGIVGDTCYIHTDYRDNRENLDPDFLRLAEECRLNNPSKYRNIFLGFWAHDVEGALWTAEMIDSWRVDAAPADLDRIVVAVDPAVTSADDSDETGIVVAGVKRLRGEPHYFVLADRSKHTTPQAWGAAVVNAYHEYHADRVVAEVNNGGDLVEIMLKGFGERIPYKAVRASRGKLVRAEPVAALYERGLVHHVGRFGVLEDQMRTYQGRDTEKSPDRMDALVWALTELSSKRGSGFIA